jgi:hypothetical protein
MLRLLSFISLFAFFASCDHCICAPSPGLRLAMVSFDSTDIDTMILRKFEKRSNFSRLVDTLQCDITKVVFRAQNDTFQMAAYSGALLLRSEFDYQIVLPALSRTFRITDMNEPQLEGNCSGKVMCLNLIVSCKVDENPIPINYGIVYLKK